MAHLQAAAHGAVPFSRPATPGHVAHHLGFYGLGAMGYFMARNLAKTRSSQASPSPLMVYNRSAGKSEQLQKELGADKIQIAQSPEQLVQECDIVFTSLASDAVVKSVYEQFAAALKVRATFQRRARTTLRDCCTTYLGLCPQADLAYPAPITLLFLHVWFSAIYYRSPLHIVAGHSR